MSGADMAQRPSRHDFPQVEPRSDELRVLGLRAQRHQRSGFGQEGDLAEPDVRRLLVPPRRIEIL